MGSYNKGILGPFRGNVGSEIGYSCRGKELMRGLPKETTTSWPCVLILRLYLQRRGVSANEDIKELYNRLVACLFLSFFTPL